MAVALTLSNVDPMLTFCFYSLFIVALTMAVTALTVSIVNEKLTFCVCLQRVYWEPQLWRWLSLCIW